MNLLSRLKGAKGNDARNGPALSWNEYGTLVQQLQFQFGGLTYGTGFHQTLTDGSPTERPSTDFVGLTQAAYAANGPVFACMLVRQLVFSSIRFRWQRLRSSNPSESFGTADLSVLERPWPGGTTQDMLTRMIQDADLAGNSYWHRQGDEVIRLRPDWVEIVGAKRHLTDRPNRGRGQVGWVKMGYLYTEGGPGSGSDPVAFTVDEVAHFAPIPDPLGVFTGMSWLTPIVREIQADQAMTRHQQRFMDNGATPNMVVTHAAGADLEKVKRFSEMMAEKHSGIENAGKTLHLYPGADATIVGTNLEQVDFKNVRGGGETRIAAAAGVPPVIVGLSEGLAAATYSNYGQARRRLADGTAHPLWGNLAGSLEPLLKIPGREGSTDVRLWYDASDVPFLREDEADAAKIAETKARTIKSYIDAGYEPESVIRALEANDLTLLDHTGLVSVQLLAPGQGGANGTNQVAVPGRMVVRALATARGVIEAAHESEAEDDGNDAPA
ncbi:phage portal protein [Nocardia wallacei]|uniref:phage portal protein n=1 Tax=Nocardia wallacei TaxID=480035 RepID=UPI002453B772|nr:phage portal protein [Nocardia wallacei]